MANLDIIEREGLVERVAAMETASSVTPIRRLAGAPLVGEIRTVGLTAAVAIKPELLAADRRDPGARSSARRSATGSRRASCAATRCRSRRRS